MEHELEDAVVNKQRKMLNFVLKLLQTRRYAGFCKWRASVSAWREEDRRDRMATRIQTAYRMYVCCRPQTRRQKRARTHARTNECNHVRVTY